MCRTKEDGVYVTWYYYFVTDRFISSSICMQFICVEFINFLNRMHGWYFFMRIIGSNANKTWVCDISEFGKLVWYFS